MTGICVKDLHQRRDRLRAHTTLVEELPHEDQRIGPRPLRLANSTKQQRRGRRATSLRGIDAKLWISPVKIQPCQCEQ